MPDLDRATVLALPAGRELDGLVDEHVWGIDRTANTPRRINLITREAAAGSEPEDGVEQRTLRLCGELYVLSWDGTHGPFPCGWPWATRVGKPWQAALEAHVAAWRAPPSRAWSQDWVALEAMVERLRPRYRVSIDVPGGTRSEGDHFEVALYADFWEQDEPDIVAHGDSAPHAVALAAILTTLET